MFLNWCSKRIIPIKEIVSIHGQNYGNSQRDFLAPLFLFVKKSFKSMMCTFNNCLACGIIMDAYFVLNSPSLLKILSGSGCIPLSIVIFNLLWMAQMAESLKTMCLDVFSWLAHNDGSMQCSGESINRDMNKFKLPKRGVMVDISLPDYLWL